jgi:hypothetical protein
MSLGNLETLTLRLDSFRWACQTFRPGRALPFFLFELWIYN